jgi:hypothetical protein
MLSRIFPSAIARMSEASPKKYSLFSAEQSSLPSGLYVFIIVILRFFILLIFIRTVRNLLQSF